MTLEQLQEHIENVLSYNFNTEFNDALIQLREGNVDSVEELLDHHVIGSMLLLADFVGWPTYEDRAKLEAASALV